MELSSRFVGLRCRGRDIELTARCAMNFAAGLADNNPWYFDDSRPEGTLAPPMLSVALTWPISGCLADSWADNDFPHEVLTQQVHYSEVLEWHRPMRPGDRVHIEGEVKAILPHRAGTHLIMEYRAVNEAGELLFIEYTGALLRGVTCSDSGTGADAVPPMPRFRSFGEPVWEQAVHIGALAAHVYDGCADIHFPIHSSKAFARAVGLPGTIYQGTATLGVALREITNREAGGDPRRLRRACCLFTGMVELDSDIRVQVMAKQAGESDTEVYFVVLNAEGRPAIRSGLVTLSA